MLHEQRLIRLRQEIVPAPKPDESAPPHLSNARLWHTQFDADGQRYYVDVHDSHAITDVDCDVYLKRSYLGEAVPRRMSHKVRPLGLNCEVYKDGVDAFELQRRRVINGAKSVAMYIGARMLGPHWLSVSQLGRRSGERSEPRIVFMCRAWNPDELGRSAEKNAERRSINAMRAGCVIALRKAFGSRFTGGFAHTPYAVANFPHALLPDARMADRKNYLKLLRQHQIGVATTGLHRSNGWKLAEYVSGGMAVICEPLWHDVPDFHAGVHYLPFRDPAECVEAAGRLLDDPGLCAGIRRANASFYTERLRPDKLMQHAVRRASGETRDSRHADARISQETSHAT